MAATASRRTIPTILWFLRLPRPSPPVWLLWWPGRGSFSIAANDNPSTIDGNVCHVVEIDHRGVGKGRLDEEWGSLVGFVEGDGSGPLRRPEDLLPSVMNSGALFVVRGRRKTLAENAAHWPSRP